MRLPRHPAVAYLFLVRSMKRILMGMSLYILVAVFMTAVVADTENTCISPIKGCLPSFAITDDTVRLVAMNKTF
jgi:hypothetical protein